MTGPTHVIHFESRFCGPPGVANGGFACGSLAALADGPAEVTLHRPPPLDRPLEVRGDADGGLLMEDRDGMLLATVRRNTAEIDLEAPAAITLAQARAAADRATYYGDPVFPGCFVCGPDRAAGDGLGILSGPVNGTGTCAAPWTPDSSVAGDDGRVRAAVVWAALDCPSGLAALEAAGLPGGTAIVLGRMRARIDALPHAGEACHVVGWPLRRSGRTLSAASVLVGPGGRVMAAARTVWVTVTRGFGVGGEG
ncbi:hypothetical protein AB0F17_03325 [Nonomuraea sp. NPDC026600]|uniref:hypothetical protein n=1 Tax=Nonomuraea sp. NPDC026600 TaxID=3155363 RepID=UPI0033C1CA5C